MTITQEEIEALRELQARAAAADKAYNVKAMEAPIPNWPYVARLVAHSQLDNAVRQALPDLLDLASAAITAREGAIREAAKVVTDRANAIHAIRIDAGELAGPYLKERENECDLLESAILSFIPTQEERNDD